MDRPLLVTSADGMEQMCVRLLKEPAVAVDTEFFWEDTFYPILGLLQLAVADGSCWLVDPLAVGDAIQLFGPVLSNEHVVKVLHDAQQDLTIVSRAVGTYPKAVFDTRLAAGFAGLSSECSLKSLVETLLGVSLEKSETRSNWLQRPLTPQQLEYAADDVVYLPRVRDLLVERVKSEEVRGWMGEEFAAFDDPSLYLDREPREMYLRVKGAGSLAPRQLAILRELAAWREVQARKRDWPRSHVLEDFSLMAATEELPQSVAEFKELRGVSRRMPDAAVLDVLEAMKRGMMLTAAECPVMERHSVEEKKAIKPKADAMLARIADACKPFGLDPALVASRRDVETWLYSTDLKRTTLPLGRGWRARFAV